MFEILGDLSYAYSLELPWWGSSTKTLLMNIHNTILVRHKQNNLLDTALTRAVAHIYILSSLCLLALPGKVLGWFSFQLSYLWRSMRAVSAYDFGSQGPGLESAWGGIQLMTVKLHCTVPFIIVLPSSQYVLTFLMLNKLRCHTQF